MKHRFMGAAFVVLMLVVLLPLVIYIPAVQDYACRRAVEWLNSVSDEVEYSVGSVRIDFPLKVRINQVAVLSRPHGDTLVSMGSLRTGIDNLQLRQSRLMFNQLSMRQVTVHMDSLNEALGLNGSLAELELSRIALDLEAQQLSIAEVMVDEPHLHLWLGPSQPDSAQVDEPLGWTLDVEQARVQQGHITLDMSPVSLHDALTAQSHTPYLDHNHLDLNAIDLECGPIHYDDLTLRADVSHLSATEQNAGLKLRQLATRFSMTNHVIEARETALTMAGDTWLNGNLLLDLGMFDSIPTGVTDLQLTGALDSVSLVRLASHYLPSLSQCWVDATTTFSLNAHLTPDSLDLRQLQLEVPQHVLLIAEAFALQPFDAEQRELAATLKGNLSSSDFLLSAFVAAPSARTYRLPDALTLDMEATQRSKHFSARLDLRQRMQPIVQGEARYDVQTDSYHLSAAMQQMSVPDFLPQAPLDQMTMHVEADGRHFAFPDRWTRLEANVQIDSIGYRLANGTWENLYGIGGQASLLGGRYVADLRSEHPTLQFDTHLEGIYLRDTLTAGGHLNAPFIDLARLPGGLAIADLGRLSFSSSLALAYNWGDVAEGGLSIDSLRYEDDKTSHTFDDIVMTLESRPDMLYADITGGDATLCLNTERGISEFPTIVSAISSEVNRQLGQMRFDFSALQQALPRGMLDFHMAQDNPFYPAINYFGYQFNSIDLASYNLYNLNLDATIVGFRNEDRTLDFDSIIAEIRPCQYQLKGDSLRQQREGYRLNAHALHIDPKPRETYDIHARGLLMPDSVMLDVNYVDGNYVTLYDAAASLAIGNDTVTLRLERDPVLYAQPFTVNVDNYISLMEYMGGMEHHRTSTAAKVLMKGPRGMALDIYTRKAKNRDVGNQMMVRLQNLDLDYASKAVMWDRDVSGQFDMTLLADFYPDSLGAQLRSGIRSLRLGDYGADTLAFDGRLRLASGIQDVEGVLTIDSIVKLQLGAALADTLNVRVGIHDLPLPLANIYMPSDIRLDGTTSGQLTLRGKSLEQARMDAFLFMNQARVNISDLDGALLLPPDTLFVRNNRLSIQNYNIAGANGRPFMLQGVVDMRRELANPTIDLRVQGENVLLADNRRLRLPDQYIYGRLPLTADVRVKGRLSDLDVTGKLQILSGTDLKYFLQDDPLQSTSRVDQLVEFVSFRQMDRALAHTALRPLADGVEEGVSVELKIDIDRDVKLDAYLPGDDGNHVAIVGGGPLLMQCAPDGSLTMSGVYDVKSGTVDYKLPVLPMTKNFDILNSSFVSWNGTDPGSPTIDIKASENVRTTVSNDEGNRIVQFLVTIGITGTLDALDMSFTCSAPDDGSINAELESMTDEERSKTALMLLVTQTYMGGSSSGTVGMGTANAALNSVLNRQMDQMLGSALKNTDVDLGIDTYSTEAGAARTDYSIKVSQRLFNDRIRATFGGRVSSGGDASMGNGARLGDMSLEWLIKKDGSHYLKLYRRYNYQSVLEGEVIETGVGYAQERSAYKFKHLLIPTSRSRQARLLSAIRELQLKEEEEERLLREEDDEEESE